MNQCPICNKITNHTYCSLSCSNISRTAKNEAIYLKNPKICPGCQKPIPYSKRWDNTYCSHSCSARITNTKKPKKPKPTTKGSLYSQALRRFELGQVTKRRTIRKILIEKRGNNCEICGMMLIWCNKPLIPVVDHIDGNAGNCKPTNVRLTCPNCNSQTSTFCGRNKGSGRQSRGLSKYA
jgi:hypothetical protein